MIECRACRALYRASAAQIGARCPKCRMPLFERAERGQATATDLGACGKHPERVAVMTCGQCHRPVCGVCRTRWFGATLCPSCVEASVRSDEPDPRELRRLGARATWSLVLALTGGCLLAIALLAAALVTGAGGGLMTFLLVLALVSLIPAAFAVGHGAAVLLVRGPRAPVAAAGMIISGAHLGIFLGLLLINLWHN
jgi:hypothetical protein